MIRSRFMATERDAVNEFYPAFSADDHRTRFCFLILY